MASKRYKVSFYFYTDCRTDWVGEAHNDLAALAIATAACTATGNWCDLSPGFKVVIERDPESFPKEWSNERDD